MRAARFLRSCSHEAVRLMQCSADLVINYNYKGNMEFVDPRWADTRLESCTVTM
jgi:hypothetical protein